MFGSRLSGLLGGGAFALTVLMAPIGAAPQSAFAFDAGMALPGDPALANLVATEQALIDLANADREANGLATLQFDADTLNIARQRAEGQLGTPALSHYDEGGQLVFAQLLSQANLPYGLAGENLARASVFDGDIAARVEQALMQSPTHRKNILEPRFKRVAIGVATDSNGEISFTEVYRD